MNHDPENSLDSSAWIEVLHKGSNSAHFEPLVRQPHHLLVSTIALYEVWKYCLRTIGADAGEAVVATMKLGRVIPVDDTIALAAGTLSHERKIPLADALIYTTATLNGATLWTQDADHEGLKGCRFFPKVKQKK
jgi:toxin FitB